MIDKRSVDLKDVLSGVLMIAAAAGFAWIVLRPSGLSLGTARSMGPGYFPLMVSMILAALGLIMVVTSFGRATPAINIVPLRSMILVLGAPVVFGAIVRPLGFVAAVACIVMISAWASYRMTVKWAVLTTIGMTIFCVVLFYYLLAMPVSLWGDGSMVFFK
jgi:hypothetical protein